MSVLEASRRRQSSAESMKSSLRSRERPEDLELRFQVVLILAALVVLGRAGYWGSRLPRAIFQWGTWILVFGMLLSSLANFASPTVGERFFLGPSVVLLALLCLVATRTPAR